MVNAEPAYWNSPAVRRPSNKVFASEASSSSIDPDSPSNGLEFECADHWYEPDAEDGAAALTSEAFAGAAWNDQEFGGEA